MRAHVFVFVCTFWATSVIAASDQTRELACPFEAKHGRFVGTPLEQAKCLLRKIFPRGIISQFPAEIPKSLADRLGQKTGITREKLIAYLQKRKINAVRELGGDVRDGLVKNPLGLSANYFVIHDTADPLSTEEFPPEMNSPSWPPNRLDVRPLDVAHVFINRVGASATGNSYSEEVQGTKRERSERNIEGLFLHHELVQPRIKGEFRYHAKAPDPGFTEPQLKRLALLYIVASVRRGTWLIPSFHCLIDHGIPGGHDDPQNFDLPLWVSMIDQVQEEILNKN